MRRSLLPALAILLVGSLSLAVAQQVSSGGSFLPLESQVLGSAARWTWKNSTDPVCFEGSTDDESETCVKPVDPTADRTLSLPNATDTLVGKATTDILTNKTLTAPVLGGTVTGTYTLGGTPTITAPTVTSITNTGTLTLPTATGGVPVLLDCGSTGSGNQTCSVTAAAVSTKIYAGQSTLAANAAVITFPTAFAATTSFRCVANDITTRANPVQMLSTSTTSATITNTTGATDVINWFCIGQ